MKSKSFVRSSRVGSFIATGALILLIANQPVLSPPNPPPPVSVEQQIMQVPAFVQPIV